MSIHGISGAAHRALGGISRAVQEVEQVATDVAGVVGGQSNDKTSELLSTVTRLPELKQQVLANARVIETSEQLLRELYNQPRR